MLIRVVPIVNKSLHPHCHHVLDTGRIREIFGIQRVLDLLQLGIEFVWEPDLLRQDFYSYKMTDPKILERFADSCYLVTMYAGLDWVKKPEGLCLNWFSGRFPYSEG